ncbi:MAG: cation transporter [Tannerella sp.]|jgi:Cu(I)/Ag(I) efflux system membrane fusion protein|nr:cation transporter [Tannerella sp.]
MKKVILMLSAIALIATTNLYAQEHTHNHGAKATEKKETVSFPKSGDEKGELTVGGACGMCKTRIEKAAKAVKGVSAASYDLKSHKLQVNFDAKQTSLAAISKAEANAGHDTNLDKADDKVYDSLPGCCKYRK